MGQLRINAEATIAGPPPRLRPMWRIGAACAVLACGGGEVAEPDAADARVVSVEVVPEATLIVGAGGEASFSATARTGLGTVVPGGAGALRWSLEDPTVATIAPGGAAGTSTAVVTGVAAGVTRVVATIDGVRGSASLEVFIPEEVARYEPGRSYFGRSRYVEYIPGELPVILSAPHGGRLIPAEIRERRSGTHVTDTNSMELTRALRGALLDLTGRAPHVILSHLQRPRMDPNREIVEAAEGNPFAEQAWREFQGWIETARTTVAADFGAGLYLDVHGHGHDIDRLELGYLLTADELNQSDAVLDGAEVVARTSIRALGRTSSLPFSRLLRGPASFGGLLEAEGVASVPSPGDPSPGDAPYFRGGYNTRRHGSLAEDEVISGIQLEHHFAGLRDNDANRRAYAEAAARVIRRFMLEHYGGFGGTSRP
ncbi:hypothetical protein [Candidatus Palauibacter sp.]|uniref:hypothetical protein n=1 Tax=Candidatus Palauibacter sp. TaxID=3101350 RepID=UPI003AF2648D